MFYIWNAWYITSISLSLSLSLSLSEWSDVSWVQREWLSKYCIYSRLWDGVSPVCFHAVFRCVPLPSHSVHSPVVHLTHTCTCRHLVLLLLLRQAPKSWFPPHLCQKQHTESSQLIWGSRRAVSVNHGIIPCHTIPVTPIPWCDRKQKQYFWITILLKV